MKFEKPPLSYTQQVDLLASRGLAVGDNASAAAFLKAINYYRFSAYCIPFEAARHSFGAGTTFENIERLYEFDRRLRMLVVEIIEPIEVSLRTTIAYHLAHQAGAFAHKEAKSFRPEFQHADWLEDILAETQRSQEVFVKHFKENYDEYPHLPVWTAIEIMSFGSLSKLFSGLPMADKQVIASQYEIKAPVLKSWLHTLVYIRNLCAHHARLWNRELGIAPTLPDKDLVRILQRKVYIGLITNDRTKQEFPGQQPPIVLPAVFERAQDLLRSHVRRQGHVSERANKYGFRLKGLTRCGECQNAVVPYIRSKAKTGKVYLYYKCLSKQNGLPVRCSVTSIGAQKLEEFVIEKLAAVGWDRPLLERVVEKVKTLSSEQVGPMEREKKELDGQLGAVCREIRNIIGLSKEQGASQELARKMEKLEATRKTLEARFHELAVQISYRKRAVYDVDAIQGAAALRPVHLQAAHRAADPGDPPAGEPGAALQGPGAGGTPRAADPGYSEGPGYPPRARL